MLAVRPGWDIPDAELTWRFSRSQGPGGQGVNTTDSRVELSFDVAASRSLAEHPTWRTRALERLPAVVTVTAQEHRSQLQNREAAMERLAERLRAGIAPPPRARKQTRPSKAAVDRRIAAKKRRGQTKRLRRGDTD
ncbi:MAG TPA: alternative ribosome rescue aminoacyl-tRNA hydrolase ArfB [Mycobacteriales bacterium]|nr:alternative ribosome rescue aminoacyl-tRNA hydrolase ArfB [Mycobacteriales bacterium]